MPIVANAKGSVVVANGSGGVTVISPTSSNQIFVLDSSDPKGARFVDIKELLPNLIIKTVTSALNYTALTSYQQVLELTIPGEKFNRLLSIKVVSYAQAGTTSYSVAVTNITGSIISERSFSNNTAATNDMGALSNLPDNVSVIRVSIKKNNGDKKNNVYLSSVDLELSP